MKFWMILFLLFLTSCVNAQFIAIEVDTFFVSPHYETECVLKYRIRNVSGKTLIVQRQEDDVYYAGFNDEKSDLTFIVDQELPFDFRGMGFPIVLTGKEAQDYRAFNEKLKLQNDKDKIRKHRGEDYFVIRPDEAIVVNAIIDLGRSRRYIIKDGAIQALNFKVFYKYRLRDPLSETIIRLEYPLFNIIVDNFDY